MSQTVFNPKNAKGFTFIELLIAMAILAMGMLAAVSMHFGSARNNTKGNIYTQANMLAKTQLENLKNQDVDLLVAGGPYSDPNNPINPDGHDLPPVFVPVFKLELSPMLGCFVSAKAVESLRAR